MKKLLLSSLAVVTAFAVNAQNPTTLVEEFDSSMASPCFLSWSTPGAFQGAPGHDFTAMTWNEADKSLEFQGTTKSPHSPLYYKLSGGDRAACGAGTGLVDISAIKKAKLRIKASAPFKINIYIQEGNEPSWDYSKFSSGWAAVDLTTDWQEVIINVPNDSNVAGTGVVDLTSIGGVAFELGKSDGTTYDAISNVTVSVDYMRFGEATSVSNVNSELVDVYPNPAGDLVNVSVGSTSKVELTNLAGQVVAAGASNGAGLVVLNTADVPAGVYVVSVKSDSGVATSKVVVQ